MTPTSRDEARRLFVVGLKNIHAAATQSKTMVEAQVNRLDHYPAVKTRLERHLIEKDDQLKRVEDILGSLKDRPSSLKDSGMSLMGSLSSVGASMADDEIIRNCVALYGLSNSEAAAYETLLVFGEAAEQHVSIPVLRQSLAEERAMTAFIADNLNGICRRFLELRAQGVQAGR